MIKSKYVYPIFVINVIGDGGRSRAIYLEANLPDCRADFAFCLIMGIYSRLNSYSSSTNTISINKLITIVNETIYELVHDLANAVCAKYIERGFFVTPHNTIWTLHGGLFNYIDLFSDRATWFHDEAAQALVSYGFINWATRRAVYNSPINRLYLMAKLLSSVVTVTDEDVENNNWHNVYKATQTGERVRIKQILTVLSEL